ncbi:hypothetical protein [Thermithiobacillus plumbiphilus]|uniref:HTH marR-type domain-containing protein n=1 Tax=Thermithiobacillus plumbiphilus TaxID=1729899 RepID=A0ABU9D4Q7_9PROT
MASDGFPQEINDFLIKHIHSVEQLEILLLLHRDTGRSWTAIEIAQELRGDRQSVENRLQDLCAQRMLACTSSNDEHHYYFNESDTELNRKVAGLSHIYAERRMSVINLIFSKPIDNIRVFADAFRLRKDKPE